MVNNKKFRRLISRLFKVDPNDFDIIYTRTNLEITFYLDPEVVLTTGSNYNEEKSKRYFDLVRRNASKHERELGSYIAKNVTISYEMDLKSDAIKKLKSELEGQFSDLVRKLKNEDLLDGNVKVDVNIIKDPTSYYQSKDPLAPIISVKTLYDNEGDIDYIENYIENALQLPIYVDSLDYIIQNPTLKFFDDEFYSDLVESI